MKRSIFSRILVSTLVPVFAILILIILVMIASATGEDKKRALQTAQDVTGYTTTLVETKFEDMVSLMEFTVSYVSTVVLDSSQPEERLRTMLTGLTEYMDTISCALIILEDDILCEDHYAVGFVRSEGVVHDISEDLRELVNSDEKPLWHVIPYETGEYYFDPQDLYDYGLGNGVERHITISIPINYEGERIGTLTFDMAYENLFKVIDVVQDNTESQIIIAGTDGDIVYSKYDDYKNGNIFTYITNPEVLANVKNTFENGGYHQGVYDSAIHGKNSIYCASVVEVYHTDKKLYFFMDLSNSAVYSSSHTAIKTVVYASIAGLMLVILFTLYASHNIVKPIREITSIARRITAGDYNIQIFELDEDDPKLKNEILILRKELEKMVVQLYQNHELKLLKVEADMEKEKAIASAKAQTRFFANISHEIRTPMNSILGISQILLHDDNFTERQKKYLTDIKVSSDSLLRIINDILDLSKLESGKMKLTYTHYNFAQLLDNVRSLTAFLAEQKKLEFIYEEAGEPPYCLYGDELRLRQVIVNVVSNAVKFTSRGSVRMKVIFDESTVRFEITDTGIGIHEDELPMLFQAFEQTESSTKTKEAGTGLGLSISKNLLSIMGGDITVKSVYGEGSTFRISVPKVIGDSSKLKGALMRSELYFTPQTRILIVDDNDINLHVANGLIGALFGINCDLALSGREAVAAVKLTDYDLVFMDHMMPEMDGVETTAAIRALGGKYEELVIVALTANAVIGARELLLSAGMNDFLSKPIEKDELYDILNRWIPKEKRLSTRAAKMQAMTQAEYSPKIEQASEIPDLDVAAGLKNVAGKQAIYEKSLCILKDKIPEIMSLLPTLLGRDNLKDFGIQVHGMKSSLASVGAMSLSKMALKLEQAAKNNDALYCTESLPIFIERLEQMCASLRLIFDEGNDGALRTKGGISDMLENVALIKKYASEFNYDMALSQTKLLRKFDYGKPYDEYINKIFIALESFDYDMLERSLNDVEELGRANS